MPAGHQLRLFLVSKRFNGGTSLAGCLPCPKTQPHPPAPVGPLCFGDLPSHSPRDSFAQHQRAAVRYACTSGCPARGSEQLPGPCRPPGRPPGLPAPEQGAGDPPARVVLAAKPCFLLELWDGPWKTLAEGWVQPACASRQAPGHDGGRRLQGSGFRPRGFKQQEALHKIRLLCGVSKRGQILARVEGRGRSHAELEYGKDFSLSS